MSDWMESTIAIVVMVLVLTASIALHEIGHLVPAKRFGVKVTQYMIGFGPTVWSRRRGETEYGFKWIPAGGYIRMIGMFPPGKGEDEHHLRESSTGAFQSLAEDASHAALREIKPGDEGRVFYKLSVPKKVVVMLGGPTMNLVIAVVLLTILLVGFGDPRERALTTTVATVSECVVAAGSGRTSCSPDDPIAPANEAGVRPGDRVVSFAGEQVTDWEQMRGLIRERADEATPMVVERDGAPLDLELTPMLTQVVRIEGGEVVLDEAGQPQLVEAGFVGVSPVQELQPQPVSAVPGFIGDQVVAVANVVARLPVRMVDVAQAAFGEEERDPAGPIGIVGVGRLAGEYSAFDDVTVRDKVAFMLGLMGSLNVALFVFNLIPLLPLDGGHVAGALWEGLRRQLARLRGRADPGPVDVAKALPLVYVVSIALIAMSVLLLYADIVRPITLRG